MAETEVRTEEIYGKKIDYDPQWRGPLSKTRVQTDFSFLVSLGIYLIVWLGIAIYAYSMGNLDATNRIKRDSYEDNATSFATSILQVKNIAFAFTMLALFLSLSYIILLRWFAKVIVYTAITATCILLSGVFCGTTYLYATNNQHSECLFISIASSISLLFVVILVFAFRKKINIACEVIKESSKAVIFFPSSLMFPVLPCILYSIISAYAASVFIYLNMLSSNYYNEIPKYIYFFHFVNLFGYYWLMFFVQSFLQIVLSGTFASWYWTLDKNYVPNNTILRFMHITTRYHLGTLAFGSLILTICRIINLFLSFIRNRLQGSCNPLACFFFGWYKFIFGSLERFVKFINRNAFIMSAVHGTGFMQSAKDAFNLLMRNILKVLVINKVTDMILFLGVLKVVGLSLLATWGYCNNYAEYQHVMAAAMVLVLLTSLVITMSFFLVLKTAIDTIFLCVLEDSERNDGSLEKPYFMSFKLKNLLLE